MKIDKENSMQRRVFLALGIVCCLSAVARADYSINVGSHTYPQNSGIQTIDVNVDSSAITDPPVQGVDFRAEVLPGGPILTGGAIVGDPLLLFDANFGAVADGSNFTTLVDLGTTTSSGFIFLALGPNLLGRLTIDTTGVAPGTYALVMSNTGAGVTDFGTIPIAVQDGNIIIEGGPVIPEPSSIVLGLFAVAGLGAVAIRKRRMA
jgi:hypothetical protein